MCPLILKRHMCKFHTSFICRLIFNAHVNVMYHKQICRLQPTTSYHTVLGFPILARVPAHNFFQVWFHPRDFLCMFISNGLTSPKWSPAWPTPRLKLSRVQDPCPHAGSPCHCIFYLVEDGPLCRHRIRAKRVIFDNLFHFNFIKIGCNFCVSLSLVMVSYRGSPG